MWSVYAIDSIQMTVSNKPIGNFDIVLRMTVENCQVTVYLICICIIADVIFALKILQLIDYIYNYYLLLIKHNTK